MVTTTYCPTLSGDPAVTAVGGGYDTFMSLAPRSFDAAVEFAGKLTEFVIAPISFNADFDFTGQLAPFQRPVKPTIDANRFNFNMPPGVPDAPAFEAREVELVNPPDYSITDPVISYGPRPDTPNVPVPVPPPAPTDLVVPDAPDYDLPPLPTLLDLNLPPPPTIDMPAFLGQRPDFIEPPIDENWSWSPQQYTSVLFDKIKAKVSAMMDGGSGLEPIEAVLFQRGVDRIERETRRDIDTRINEFATRGFSEPNGVLGLAIDEIIQGGANRKADASREITIESYRELLLNMRFAVQQGIATEQVAVNLFLEEQRLSLQASQFMRETAIALVNVRLSVFQARMQGYQTDAQVYQTLINSQLAKVELYRAQIDGERARGEINEQRVRIYTEQVRTLNVMADFYRAQIAGVQAQADVERAVIERFKAQIDAYSARWEAYGEEFGAYRAQVEAENSKVQVHRSLVEAYSTRVQAANNINRGRLDGEELRIRQHGQQLSVFQSLLEKLRTLVTAEASRVQSEAQRAGALSQIYTAEAGVETAASAASDRSLQIGLERAKAESDTNLRAAEIAIQQNISLTQTSLEAIKTQATVLAQLAASAFSSMNFSASLSSSTSNGRSCSQSVSWTGEAPDLT